MGMQRYCSFGPLGLSRGWHVGTLSWVSQGRWACHDASRTVNTYILNQQRVVSVKGRPTVLEEKGLAMIHLCGGPC